MRRAIVSELGALFGGPDALGVAVEGLGRPEGGALLLVAAVLVEAASGGDQLADGRDRAVVLQVRERPRQELPRFVAVLTEDGEVLGRRRPDGVERLGSRSSLRPKSPWRRPAPTATRASCCTAPGLVEDGERLTPEDVRMSRQLDQRDGALEIGGNGELRPVETSRFANFRRRGSQRARRLQDSSCAADLQPTPVRQVQRRECFPKYKSQASHGAQRPVKVVLAQWQVKTNECPFGTYLRFRFQQPKCCDKWFDARASRCRDSLVRQDERVLEPPSCQEHRPAYVELSSRTSAVPHLTLTRRQSPSRLRTAMGIAVSLRSPF